MLKQIDLGKLWLGGADPLSTDRAVLPAAFRTEPNFFSGNFPLTRAVQDQPITTHKLQRQVPAAGWGGPVPCVHYLVNAWNESLKTRILKKKQKPNHTMALREEGESEAKSKFRFCQHYISPVMRQRYVKSSNVCIQWLWSHHPPQL